MPVHNIKPTILGKLHDKADLFLLIIKQWSRLRWFTSVLQNIIQASDIIAFNQLN